MAVAKPYPLVSTTRRLFHCQRLAPQRTASLFSAAQIEVSPAGRQRAAFSLGWEELFTQIGGV